MTIVGVETVVVVVDVVALTVVVVGTGVIVVVVVVVDVAVVVVVVVVIFVAEVVVAVVVSVVADDLPTIPGETVSMMYNTYASVSLRSEQAGCGGLLRRAIAVRAP